MFTCVPSLQPAGRVVGRFSVMHTGRMWRGTMALVRQDGKFDGVFKFLKTKTVALFNLNVTFVTFTPNIENKKTKKRILRYTIACFVIIIYYIII